MRTSQYIANMATVKGEPVNLQPSMGGWKPSTANHAAAGTKICGRSCFCKGEGQACHPAFHTNPLHGGDKQLGLLDTVNMKVIQQQPD